MERVLLSVVDYLVFGLLLLISLGIGIFYSFRQKTATEYLHGSYEMSLFPVTLSLIVSYVSALTMQGLPAEVYMHGIGILFAILALWGIILVAFTFLPIYYYLKPTSIFEYLEKRYCSKIPSTIASLLTALTQTVYCGFILFGPAAAMESMSAIPTNYSILCIAVVCTVYTSVGGIRGVMWTDVFQALIMILGFITIIIMGCAKLGLSTIWSELEKHGRTEINFGASVTVRNSFWICLIFMGFQWHCLFMNQTAMVRYTSLPTLKGARIAIILGGFGVIFLMLLAVCTGAVVFAYFSLLGCDPLLSGDVYTSNQVVPFYVVNVLNYPGIPGLFLAATVASTLSSMSSAQTSIVAILWKDVITAFIPKISELKKTIILKIIVLIVGVLAIMVAFIARYAGETLYNMGFAVLDVLNAPVFGMFILGAVCSFASVWGAMIGCITAMGFVSWISFGRLIHGTNWTTPPLVNDTCVNITTSMLSNSTINEAIHSTMSLNGGNFSQVTDSITQFPYETTSMLSQSVEENSLINLYSLSSYANPILAIAITLVIGTIVSLIPGLKQKKPLDKNLMIFGPGKCCFQSGEDNEKSNEQLLEKHSDDSVELKNSGKI